VGDDSDLTTRGAALPRAFYEDPGSLLKGTVEELGRALAANNVVGEPLVFGDVTVIPLMSIGLGFGAGSGGGAGKDGRGDQGQGGGGGGAGGIGVKPIGVVIIDPQGARLEAIPEPSSGFEKLGSAIASVLEARQEKAASGD
jgi:uncharacterized spore protein YtfJ